MVSYTIVLALSLSLALCASATPGNPFSNGPLYTNPDYEAEVQTTIDANPSLAPLLKKAQTIPAFYWIDTMARIGNITRVLDGAKAKNNIASFVIYDLPDRDCAAAASNGEITCEDSTCAAGLARYKSQYIDVIVNIFKKYTNVTIVLVIEPDSLPNLATNLNIAKCGQAQSAYKQGVAYAIKQLAAVGPNVHQYIDAAHGGWLGWPNNLVAGSQIFSEVLQLAGGAQLVRGFATNTANYQPLGSLTSTADPCQLANQYNKAIDESHYIELLSAALQAVGITGKYFITDTSRNGVTNMRSSCSNWCNIKGAGLGMRPSTDTSSTGLDIIDAFVWVKTPGEADGTSNSTAPRYDFHCGSTDSFIPAPQAGQWFPDYFIMLAKNAIPAL
eukprot:TRINITY_DN1634_c0_g1_i1.p1 TRINITY_DN1634_c0_g1~~TRINITY_DN1634_c0_g1_i1.p1  ORF type:complete len:418 (-),score=107.59 TRINITY_DN1634_c0_g1_i1:61-1221(-)